MKSKYLLYLGLSVLFGCEKLNYYPDKTIKIEPSKLIAHRGGRNTQFKDNTLDGIKAALRHKDGIEVDVQMSKDQTIWLSHSSIVESCNHSLKCFAETSDDEIKNITVCDGKDISYTQLEHVFQFIKDSFTNKIVCIDLKAWVPCGVGSLGIEGMMKKEAEVIINLAEKYGIEDYVLFETETASVLEFIKSKNNKIGTFLTSFGDLERAMLIALKANFTGISFKNNSDEILTRDKIDLMHKKGLKIIVWNLLNNSEIKGLTEIGVDYIQMDL